ncbi:putative hydrolase [Stieleria neptunia]|uniref:Putative hydrolase n=1 Tax=Stieleria neptunia TaxID=2527979 RepID=A0A518I1N0_9BACT|nr:alpha/beta fold hydrolase [Stieleria neptunia]QDV46991.1 putative hydrolase [Stieleria neptunia]
MKNFVPPPFKPDLLIRGGHLQTLASLRAPGQQIAPDANHVVELPDGDAIVLHENAAVDGGAVDAGARRSVVLFHGLSGCHGSPYMIRLAGRFVQLGWTVYRVDMRGCGAARDLSRGLSHAGRSEDVLAALDFVARRDPSAQLAAAGVSLGGNQLLRLAGRIGAGLDARPEWFDRLERIAVVAPPIDLVRCSENMERLSRRLYNYYFIRTLFERIAPAVREREPFQKIASLGRPKTLLELDDRLTAPLSGFEGALAYYRQCGATHVTASNPVKTLVLAAKDDPIVPADCFTNAHWPEQTRVLLTATGGHAGFVGRRRSHWMDDCLIAWLNRL